MNTALLATGWGGLAVAAVAAWLVLRAARAPERRRAWTVALVAALAVTACASGYALWCRYRPAPDALQRELSPGIRYERSHQSSPRPLVVHVARIDLDNPDLEFVTTPAEADGTFAARTATTFARESGALVAINAQFFDPFYSNHPLDYYPRAGDPVRALWFGENTAQAPGPAKWRGATLSLGPGLAVGLGGPAPAGSFPVSGRNVLVVDGVARSALVDRGPAPRSAIGRDSAFDELLFVVVDGRQPGYSEGLSLDEMATLMAELGSQWAVELDGGGSSALVAADGAGAIEVLNCPIHTRIPCRERPVANHIGVRVRP